MGEVSFNKSVSGKICAKVLTSIFMVLMAFGVSGQAPLNWTRDEINPGEDFTLYPDESIFTDGIRSCHLQLNSGSIPYLKSDVFYITPGAGYEFSFNVLDNDTAGQVRVYADFYDIYGFDVYDMPPVFSEDSAEWQQINWSGTVPVQAAVGYVLIKFYNQPDLYNFTKTADIWLDNFQFTENGGMNLVVNGSFEEWNLGYEEAWSGTESLIYPNPASDIVNILFDEECSSCQILDITGRRVMEASPDGEQSVSVDIRGLPAGIYFVNLFSEQGLLNSVKLVKK